MVFRRFHRTAGPVLFLSAGGILVALFLPFFQPAAEAPLVFGGFTNTAGVNRALFLLQPGREEDSRWFNMTRMDQQVCAITYVEAGGRRVEDDPVAAFADYAPNGWRRLSVPVPERATSICLTVRQRVRHGKVDAASLAGAGPPKVVFVLPFGRVERFRSGAIAITNSPAGARPQD